MANEGVLEIITERLQLPKYFNRKISKPTLSLENWNRLVELIEKPKDEVKIALVGKYVSSKDAYKSVKEALSHASIYAGRTVDIVPIQPEDLEVETPKEKREEAWRTLKECR